MYWSDEDQCFIGQCPELFFGGTHGDNALEVSRTLSELVREEVEERIEQGEVLPVDHA